MEVYKGVCLMKKILILMCFFLLFSISSFAADKDILAQIGDKALTRADFQKIISYLPESQQTLLKKDKDAQVRFLEGIVNTMLIAKIASKQGFEQRPDIKEQLEYQLNNFVTRLYVQKEILEKIEITDKDLELYYKSNKKEFKAPSTLSGRKIFIKVSTNASAEEKKNAKDRIEAALKRIKDGEDFAKVASEVSEDKESKDRGGFFKLDKIIKPKSVFERTALSLKLHEISSVIQASEGFYIIKIEEKTSSEPLPFAEVKDKVKEKMLADISKEKIDAFIKKAMKDNKVQINADLLK